MASYTVVAFCRWDV